jgi:hypothetical protein
MMYVIEILLPLRDNQGKRFPGKLYDAERKKLVEEFGGLTAYSKVPAKGLWKDKGRTQRDDLVIFEVIAKRLDRRWWKAYRHQLERSFRQKEMMVRAFKIEML